MSVNDLARAERADLVELLEQLTPRQWAAPSLCDRWTVQDVAAHVISYDGLSARELLRQMVRGRGNPHRANDLGVRAARRADPAAVLEQYRRHPEPRGLTAQFGGRIALTDGLIHQQDIRRALGRPRAVPPERLRVVLPFALTSPLLGGLWRVRGMMLRATDLDWRHGRGPEVTGPAEALLMAMAGRPDPLPELAGPGLPVLRRRLERP
ncbi:maleylpyruvate isomerase family mycothiol-dependent enzyme [Nakamurella leprariae]|uniref:Maleylpyruvate isomerase family mycothiol-dependent enzyme n=1 Tax=Nakamurella leprariae TaxID=2803911 RepID=A0A938Y9H1_9ACTN|nr:maleylpyruvate isomerase family mycothiol-dependent enzyme [Nakamurella leprariae]MBM9468511.1 maleylpyruvate isomerase family mycothiol-dependent enzyme [Nakamurella leprariae]